MTNDIDRALARNSAAIAKSAEIHGVDPQVAKLVADMVAAWRVGHGRHVDAAWEAINLGLDIRND